MLAEEQSKTGELEERRRRQEALYREEKARLESLEAERRRHDSEYEVNQSINQSIVLVKVVYSATSEPLY